MKKNLPIFLSFAGVFMAFRLSSQADELKTTNPEEAEKKKQTATVMGIASIAASVYGVSKFMG